MDYKEKYEMALEGIQEILSSGADSIKMSRLKLRLQGILPELKETDDERIRKALIEEFLGWSKDSGFGRTVKVSREDILAWLEKQGEDKKENLNILQRFSFYSYKDEPDILYLAGVFVNKEFRNKGIGTKILEVTDEVAKSLNCHTIRLKTKKDSNAERLYRTHGYNSLTTEDNDEIWLEKQGNKNEKDYGEELKKCKANPLYFFDKYVKVKLKRQKPAWSEEDKAMVEDIIEAIDTQYAVTDYNEMVNWLKSLKDIYTWKPSDEQIEAVKRASNGSRAIEGNDYLIMASLYQDLKKLREE